MQEGRRKPNLWSTNEKFYKNKEGGDKEGLYYISNKRLAVYIIAYTLYIINDIY